MVKIRVHDRVVYASSAPCADGLESASELELTHCLEAFCADLHARSVSTIVVLLTQEELDEYYGGTLVGTYRDSGFEVIHFPIEDYGVPALRSFRTFIANLEGITRRKCVLVHCHGGIGRTGTVIAGLFITLGSSYEAAIGSVRRKIPGAVETDEQEELLRRYGPAAGP